MTTTTARGSRPFGTGPRGDGTGPLDRQSNRPGERVILLVLLAAAMISVATTVAIVTAVLFPAIEFFQQVPVSEFLTGTEWSPNFADKHYGVLPLLVGTAWTTAIGLTVAVPLGLGSAMLLSEYASDRLRRLLKPILELLAGVPSVVYGFFALYFIGPVLLEGVFGLELPTFNALQAGLVLGIMIIPTVASLAEDAMSAVPQALRQGSAALGSNRMHTTLRVVFPAAISGIIAAVVLGMSRAVGETMIVLLAAGGLAQLTADPTEPVLTMTAHIAKAATGQNAVGSIGYQTLFAVGLTLFVITLVINLVSIRVVRKLRQAY